MWLRGVGKEVGGLLVHERRDAVYALAPVGEAAKECLHLIGIEDAGLDPCDAHELGDLVDRATHEAETQGLHDEVLDFVDGYARLGC